MNIGKCVKIALAMHEKTNGWLAEQLGVTHQRASAIANAPSASTKMIQKLADIFNMPVSEFIALGE